MVALAHSLGIANSSEYQGNSRRCTFHYFVEKLVQSTLVMPYTVNQKVCSSHKIKRESLVTIVTPKYGVMRTPHRLGVKYTPNLAFNAELF